MSSPETARPYIGGQAVLEGVMMRSPTSFAIVVRRKDGTLVVRERGVTDTRTGWRKLPFLRGIHSLVDSLRIGNESLRFSAEHYEADHVEAASAAGATHLPILHVSAALRTWFTRMGVTLFILASGDGAPNEVNSGERKASEGKPGESKSGGMGLMALLAVLLMIALPQFAAEGVNRVFHLGLATQSPGFQVVTGALKLTIVISYLLLLRRIDDVKRMFQYHGAEHKTISTYEAEEPLTVANARAKTTLHPRCGTTFLVMVALVSIVLFTALGWVLPTIETGNRWLNNVAFFFVKLPFVPLMAGITFELQRIFARYCTVGPLRALLWPGFLVQKITTVEPDDAQLEVALASLKVTLFREKGAGVDGDDVRFPDFETLSNAETLRAA